jgi:acetyltransferase-like isoleucine patch superfamily enzyme
MMGIFNKIKLFKRCIIPSRSDFASAGKGATIGFPIYITSAKAVHLEDYTVLRREVSIINNRNEHVYIKKYTVISMNVTIITNNHRSTVGIPQCLLSASHINDTSKDLHIDEDVWVGTNATIMAGGDLGRGCIVGACSTVTKPVPPYALVVGTPAKIVGVVFTIDQIIEHEKALYPEKERFSREYLEELFSKYYEGKKVYGVQTELSEEDIQALNAAKRERGFIEPLFNTHELE